MRKNWLLFVVLLLAMGVVLTACGGEPQIVEVTRVITETQVIEGEAVEVTRIVTETEVQTVTETVVETVTVTVEAEPEPEMVDRTGGWLDTIVFVEEPNQDAGVARLIAGDIDMYADDIGGQAAVQAIRDADNVVAVTQYGLYDELFFNNAVCADEAVLNPFNSAVMREAMNWAIDRDYIADELYGGLAVPKFTAIAEAGADRGRFAPEIRSIEAKYAYNFEAAREIVTAEMEALGAELVDGAWTYNGEPIVLTGLIRIEDTRLEIGNYFANQLEEMGFQVERVERTSAELSPIWASGDPTLCEWSWYTGAWSQTAISRESGSAFEQFYMPRGYPVPSWQVFEPPARLDELSLRIFNNDFSNMEERAELVREFLPLAAEFSPRIWVTSRTTIVPYSDQVQVSADLAAGVSGAAIWSKTARFVDEVGGSMTIALPSVFTEPWNPIGGSNWVFDGMVQNGISEPAGYFDPNTGLYIPNRFERAELIVQEDFPIGQTLDWIEVSSAAEITVPDDAWVDWDAANQVFLTAAEVYTQTETALFKSTVYYPADLFSTMKWHDGSAFSPADFVMAMIMNFDQAKPESPYYDEAAVPGYEQFISAFKGTRIVSVDPFVVEYYGDNPALDAENSIVTWWPYSTYAYGDAAWHNMAIMLRAEANGSVVFTDEKANNLEVERVSMIAGPSLEILAGELEGATAEGFIPYAATLGQYVTAEDAAARYSNLAEFARRYGHYYIGTGVYFLQGVFPVEGQAILQRFEAHPDPADKFSGFAAPALAEVEIDGESRVTIGEEATFDVFLDVFGGAYPAADIDSVAYLLFDATGTQVEAGLAEAVEDGLWQVTLSGETTGALEEGSNRLEIVVVSKLVALPSLGEFQFVTAP